MLQSIDPATGLILNEYSYDSNSELLDKIDRCQNAYHKWQKSSLSTRITFCQDLASLLLKNKNKYAKVITLEMGKLSFEAQAEIEKCAKLCTYYAECIEDFLQSSVVETEFDKSFITIQPLGIILGVMPWNFPFWQVFRYAIPNLLIGNTILLKHSSKTPQCSKLLHEIFSSVNPVKDCFVDLMTPGKEVASIIGHEHVKGVTLTGSTNAGKEIAKVAGQHLKKTVLELGGSDPYIVCQDADIDLAVEKCATSRMLNTGQSCISAKRFIIEEHVYDEFLEKFTNKLKKLKPGLPLDDSVNLAPLAGEDIRDTIHEQVQAAIQEGAKCVLGGKKYDTDGFYFMPTILSNINADMSIFHQETFGPVACMVKVQNIDEAIVTANLTTYGLGSAIFTKDTKKGEAIATNNLNAGNCFVNDYVRSDPRLPFGGINQSGYGRELSTYGLLEFCNLKTVCINH
jgi:succinate-semialdehyde dehydrogenase/glutarate-semialdehyde dehydrogenase